LIGLKPQWGSKSPAFSTTEIDFVITLIS